MDPRRHAPVTNLIDENNKLYLLSKKVRDPDHVFFSVCVWEGELFLCVAISCASINFPTTFVLLFWWGGGEKGDVCSPEVCE